MNVTTKPQPLVSVITATYNRSAVLRCAIASLLRSRFGDFEQIVVGDACTDDTESAVASFADPRIRFVNLPRNHGEMAGPHNEGLRLAAGRYIAYLNHDDLWFPDHIESLLETIEREGADLAFASGISYLPDGTRQVIGAVPEGIYRPVTDIFASLWLHRRGLVDEIGPWRLSREIWSQPAQDFLIRAWKRKRKIVASNRITVLVVHATRYRDAYRINSADQQRRLLAEMSGDPGFREREFGRAALQAAQADKSLRILPRIKGLARAAAYRASLALGIAPVWLKYFLRSPRRGGYMRRIRRFRGLPPVPGGKP